jgi:hypothetical protein
LERVAIRTAVAMKYSSHVGRFANFLVALAIRSTGLFLAAHMGKNVDRLLRPGNP